MIWSWLLTFVLAVIYWFVIVPVGVLKQVVMKTSQQYDYDTQIESYWISRKSKTVDMRTQR